MEVRNTGLNIQVPAQTKTSYSDTKELSGNKSEQSTSDSLTLSKDALLAAKKEEEQAQVKRGGGIIVR